MNSLTAASLFVYVVLCLCLAAAARRKGHSGLLWFTVAFTGVDPLFTLIGIASLPNRAVERERNRERELLQSQLNKALASRHPAQRAIPEGTISHEVTQR